MLLCVDIGNTNITLCGYDGERPVLTARLATDSRRTGDQYAVEIYDILRLNGHGAAEVDGAMISSVVPPLTGAFTAAVKKLCGITPLVLGPGVKTGLNIKIDNPAQLGADLAAGAVAAVEKYPLPAVVIDLGTATTICAVGRRGEFLGGAIAAGISLTLEALTKNTAQLPLVGIEAPARAIGRNTAESMRSGLIFGAASMLDGMIARFEEELGEEAFVVATGGLAGEIIPHCRRAITVDDTLVPDGLRIIYEKNLDKVGKS